MRIEGESWENWIYPLLHRPWSRLARRAVPSRVLARLMGRLLHTRLVDSTPYFRSVRHAIASILPGDRIDRFLSEHLRYVIRFYLEMAGMIEAPRGRIKDRLSRNLRLEVGGLIEAIGKGRGVLAPTVQSNVPFRMFFAGLPAETAFRVLLHKQHPGIPRILEKADPGWDFLFLESAPGRRVIETLRAGEVIVCNIDHAYAGTEVTLTPVFGRPAVVPSGVFRAAHRYGSPVVPLTVTEDEDGVLISADEVMEWEHDELPLPIARMLERAQRPLDAAILKAPPEWMGWGNLSYRWNVWKCHAQAR
jgi:hypothetical protein